MQSKATTVKEYMDELPEERKKVIQKLRAVVKKKLPKGFKEVMSYGMLGYVVPLSIYPEGYHCNPELPLPFMNIASQKNFVGIYHMGIYADQKLLHWFTGEYAKHVKGKLDMGKSCIRLKKMNEIPYDLVGKLASKITVTKWIEIYEKSLK